jgi:tetratricopeptide (TPR) repeat protein
MGIAIAKNVACKRLLESGEILPMRNALDNNQPVAGHKSKTLISVTTEKNLMYVLKLFALKLHFIALPFLSSLFAVWVPTATAQNYAEPVRAPAATSNAVEEEYTCSTSDQATRTIRLCTREINDPTTSDKDRIRYLVKRAKAWIVEEELLAAVNDYGQVVDIDQANNKAIYARAGLYNELGEYELAKKDYTRLIESDKKKVSAYCKRGFSKLRLKEYASAIDDYTSALKINPDRLDCMVARGDVYAAIGNDEMALKDYAAALASNNRYWAAYYHRAKLYKRRGDRELAIKNYFAVLSLNRIHMSTRKELQAFGVLIK